MESKFVRVGVGVMIFRDGKVLMQKRKGAHGEGTWSFPGGHLEFGESIEECARRECYEEIGIKVRNFKIESFTNDIFEKEDKHYITIFVLCEVESGEPAVKEPDRIEEIGWFEWNNLPENLFVPLKNLVASGYILGGEK